MLILISDTFDRALPEKLARFGEVTTDRARATEADVILIRSKTKVNREYIDAAQNLKLVIRGGVGLDNIDLGQAAEKGIIVRNTADASTTAVAELAFTMMLAVTNHIARADATMRAGQWVKKELKRTELSGKTLGIVGLGRIGLALAARAQAFRMRVLGWHPDVNFTDFADIRWDLDEMLSECDYISLHTPLVAATKHMVNAELLTHFKDGAFLINTARAAIVDDEAAAAALRSGKLGGYATDVWLTDPPDGSPLFDAPNTLFTPHIGASSKENMRRIGTVIERLVGLFAAGTLKP